MWRWSNVRYQKRFACNFDAAFQLSVPELIGNFHLMLAYFNEIRLMCKWPDYGSDRSASSTMPPE